MTRSTKTFLSDLIRHALSLFAVAVVTGGVIGMIWFASVMANGMKPYQEIKTEQQQ